MVKFKMLSLYFANRTRRMRACACACARRVAVAEYGPCLSLCCRKSLMSNIVRVGIEILGNRES